MCRSDGQQTVFIIISKQELTGKALQPMWAARESERRGGAHNKKNGDKMAQKARPTEDFRPFVYCWNYLVGRRPQTRECETRAAQPIKSENRKFHPQQSQK